MLISQKFFDQCDPSYQDDITELERNLSSTEDNEQKQRFLDNFSSKYLMPKEYWELKLELSNYLWSISEEKCSSFVLKGIYHFYYDRKHEVYISDGFYRKILNLSIKKFSLMIPSKSRDYIKNALTYPHRHLEKFYQKYEENATSLPSPDLIKRHNEMKELYHRIKGAKNDDVEKWFSLLSEANDKQFIIHNIEYKIGGNLLDKKLWKIYIKYLKDENDIPELFHLYSKYCRFFLDDSIMKAEYEAEVKKYRNVAAVVPWINQFEFEKCESWGDVYGREEAANPNSAFILPNPPPMGFCGNFYANIISQDLSLPKPLIRYILDITNHALLRKFHKCCKYFFLRKPTPICYSIEVLPTKETKFKNEILLVNPNDTVSPPINNFYLTTSLLAHNFGENENQAYFISSIIPRIFQCDAKYIKIGYQKLTFNELKFFIGSGNVEVLELFDTKIANEKAENVPLEEVMKLVPNIRHFEMMPVKCTSKTAEILSNFNFNNKIKAFSLFEVFGEPINIQAFKEFCIKNMDKTFEMIISFQDGLFSEEFRTKFRESIKDSKNFSEKSINRIQIDNV
uniref:Ycf80 n=1 Tax=Panagrolaimus superbus TaxID=310955 RepID=A0A914Z283_9BILA